MHTTSFQLLGFHETFVKSTVYSTQGLLASRHSKCVECFELSYLCYLCTSMLRAQWIKLSLLWSCTVNVRLKVKRFRQKFSSTESVDWFWKHYLNHFELLSRWSAFVLEPLRLRRLVRMNLIIFRKTKPNRAAKPAGSFLNSTLADEQTAFSVLKKNFVDLLEACLRLKWWRFF